MMCWLIYVLFFGVQDQERDLCVDAGGGGDGRYAMKRERHAAVDEPSPLHLLDSRPCPLQCVAFDDSPCGVPKRRQHRRLILPSPDPSID